MASIVRVGRPAHVEAANLLRVIGVSHQACPCHGSPRLLPNSLSPPRSLRGHASATDSLRQKEYAFEMASSSIRFGPGCTKEVGMDLANMKAKRVVLVTDQTVQKLDGVKQAVESLEREGINYEVFADVRVEPKDTSVRQAIDWAKKRRPDAFLAIGGGSVIDTTKLMNLYMTFPEAEILDFVNAPLGLGKPVPSPLKPLIAVPTTAGTGSETTGTAIFDLTSKKAKTGIAHRFLKPTLGICDPLNTRSMPSAVVASTGLDVLCHALESWTAIPYYERTPRPTNPLARPAYQGANPISDIFSLQALKDVIRLLPRAVADPEDFEAQSGMLLAATLAGVGFGNAGVHLCHAMSYPIASQNPGGYRHSGYTSEHALVPHGVSVAVTAPAVFRFTGTSNPERHLRAAECFGVDVAKVRREDAGVVLAEALMEFLYHRLPAGSQPKGLRALGIREEHLDGLVEGTLPQRRVLMLAPGLAAEEEIEEGRRQLRALYQDALAY